MTYRGNPVSRGVRGWMSPSARGRPEKIRKFFLSCSVENPLFCAPAQLRYRFKTCR